MAKISETAYEKTKSGAGLKVNDDNSGDKELQRYITVYDIPKTWIKAIQDNYGSRGLSGFARRAMLEKLEKEGLL